MISMTIFWIIMLVNIVLYAVLKYRKYDKRDDIGFLLTMFAACFLVVSIVTRDPIFTQFGVPMEFEWVVGMCAILSACWRFYLRPWKERCFGTERDVSAIKADLDAMRVDLSLIKAKLIGDAA